MSRCLHKSRDIILITHGSVIIQTIRSSLSKFSLKGKPEFPSVIFLPFTSYFNTQEPSSSFLSDMNNICHVCSTCSLARSSHGTSVFERWFCSEFICSVYFFGFYFKICSGVSFFQDSQGQKRVSHVKSSDAVMPAFNRNFCTALKHPRKTIFFLSYSSAYYCGRKCEHGALSLSTPGVFLGVYKMRLVSYHSENNKWKA